MWANTNTTQAENDENVRVRGKENLVFFILFTGLRLWAKRTEYHCGNRRMKIAKREICESWRKHTASSWIYCRKSVSISLLSALFVFFFGDSLAFPSNFHTVYRLHSPPSFTHIPPPPPPSLPFTILLILLPLSLYCSQPPAPLYPATPPPFIVVVRVVAAAAARFGSCQQVYF